MGDRIRILGAKDDLGPGRLIEDEFVLWPSLTSLAAAIEDQPAGSDVSLETVLHTLPKCPQAQCSTQEQLQWLYRLANICGLYDAADVIKAKAGLS